MTTVLLTGFEPFHGHAANPSRMIAERLNGETIAGTAIVGLTLPVVFGEDTQRVFAAIAEWKPAVVLSLGLSAAIVSMDVEMFAVNHRCVEGAAALQPIARDGPAAYFSTLDVDRICSAVADCGLLPVRRHGYAGDFLCNHIFYQTLHHIAAGRLPCRAGFIHIPQAAEYSLEDEPSPSLEHMVQCVQTAIEAAVSAPHAGRPY